MRIHVPWVRIIHPTTGRVHYAALTIETEDGLTTGAATVTTGCNYPAKGWRVTVTGGPADCRFCLREVGRDLP